MFFILKWEVLHSVFQSRTSFINLFIGGTGDFKAKASWPGDGGMGEGIKYYLLNEWKFLS